MFKLSKMLDKLSKKKNINLGNCNGASCEVACIVSRHVSFLICLFSHVFKSDVLKKRMEKYKPKLQSGLLKKPTN
jgi:hypothetical protein